MKRKLAILTPGVLPVPAVKGGAVEQLITYIIEGNEKKYLYDIDLYTVNDKLLKSKLYSHTRIIKINKPSKTSLVNILFRVKNKIYQKFFHISGNDYINFKIIKIYRKNYYDSVLVENNMGLYNLLLKKITNERLYFHLHNDFDNGDVDKTIERTKKIISTADKIFVVSKFLKRKLQKLGAKNVQVAYNAVDRNTLSNISLKEVQNERHKLGINDEDYVFSYIGRLDEKKGIDKLLSAFNNSNFSKRIKCIVVGGSWNNKHFQKKLDKIISENKNIIKIGYISHSKIKKIFSLSNCIVIPTQIEEAFGEVALEAMIMGKPIICSDSGALPEIIDKNGAIVVKRNKNFEKNLSNAMKKMANNLNLSIKMGEKNQIKSKCYPLSILEYFNQFKDL